MNNMFVMTDLATIIRHVSSPCIHTSVTERLTISVRSMQTRSLPDTCRHCLKTLARDWEKHARLSAGALMSTPIWRVPWPAP